MSNVLRFGTFEADLRTAELRKDGTRIRLAPQAFKVLVALAERAGELVGRQELQRILWPNETVVEFEHSINTAIKRIRTVLNDSSAEPRYIETLSRRGYRFIAQVERIELPNLSPVPVAPPDDSARRTTSPVSSIDWENPAGATISHYRLLSVLGRGGMGIVYLAEDLRLGRQAALKFQSPALETDPMAQERFRREAFSASTLNHPNICTVYEVEIGYGRTFIAMELLEGETLRDRLSRARTSGPLPAASVIDLAIPVADALEAAHEKGVIHRDIKPGNIFVTRRGEVKVLDFGLAKVIPRRRISDLEVSREPPSAYLTQPRQTLGTASYMSPEQANGEELDTRSDLYSFGVVLYEAATGRLPRVAFATNIAAAECHGIEPRLREIIGRLLESDRTLRYQTAGDVASELRRTKRDLSDGSTASSLAASLLKPETPTAAPETISRISRISLFWPALVAVVAVFAVFSIFWIRRPELGPQLSSKLVPFSGLAGMEDDLAFSPDGKQAAFSWNGGAGDDFHIYVKLIDVGTPLALTNTPGFDSSPSWSPDGRYIAFIHDATTKYVAVVPALGGAEREITAIRPVGPDKGSRSLTWTPDRTSLLISDRSALDKPPALFVVAVDSGEKRPSTPPPPYIYGDGDPQFSPDGRTLAFLRWERDSVSAIYLQSWPRGPARRLTTGPARISGFAWAADGASIVVACQSTGALSTLWRIPLSGAAPSLIPGVGEDAGAPAIAPRGDLLAYTYQLENTDLWRIPLKAVPNRREPKKLIASPRQQVSGVYSPDGTRIAFSSDRSGSFEVWVSESDGSHPRQLTFLGSLSGTPHWSPDGRQIAFDSRVGGHAAVFVISSSGGAPRQLTLDTYDDLVPSWSRDGTRIYFASNRSGSMEIWQMSSNGGNAIQLTRDDGFEAEESVDGWLYYSRTGKGIWRKPIAGGKEMLVLDRVTARYWTLAADQLYFIDMAASPHATVNALDLATGRIRSIATLDKYPDWGASGLSVSPDGQWMIWSQIDDIISRLMLLRNFH